MISTWASNTTATRSGGSRPTGGPFLTLRQSDEKEEWLGEGRCCGGLPSGHYIPTLWREPGDRRSPPNMPQIWSPRYPRHPWITLSVSA